MVHLNVFKPIGIAHCIYWGVTDNKFQKKMYFFLWRFCLCKQSRPWWNVYAFTSEKEMQFYLEIVNWDPSIYIMDHPKFILSYHKSFKGLNELRKRDKTQGLTSILLLFHNKIISIRQSTNVRFCLSNYAKSNLKLSFWHAKLKILVALLWPSLHNVNKYINCLFYQF